MNLLKKKYFLLILCFSSFAFSQKDTDATYQINKRVFGEEITSYFSYLVTSDKNITPKKLFGIQAQLQKNYCGCENKDVASLPKNIWLLGKIKNNTKDTLNLVFYTSNAQKVTAFIISNKDTIKKVVGYISDSENRFSNETVNAFNFKLFPNEQKTIVLNQEVYLKSDLIYKFNLMTLDLFNAYTIENYRFYQENRFFLGILSGSLLLLFVYNFLMFCRTKSNSYLHYSLYLLSTFIFIILVIDRNRNSFIAKIMLHYDLVKEVSYSLSILFYALFVKCVLREIAPFVYKLIKIYIGIIIFYLLYLTTIFYKNPYIFDESSLLVIKFFKYISLGFLCLLLHQLYKKKSSLFIKYIFTGSLILIFSYILQALLEYLDNYILNRNFSKLFVRTNTSILIGTLTEISFFSYALYIKGAEVVKEKVILENLSAIKSRFFANISHEFRTPLTLIKSPVQSLQNEITDENQKRKLQLIDANSNRMLELVDQLLQLSKIDDGNLKLLLKDGNISSFLTLIIEPFEFQAKENGINFTSKINKTTQNHLFDKDVIQKIVTNLVSNAFKYNTPKEKITFIASIDNSNLKLIVSNTGSDIKKEDLSKIFERFYQKNDLTQGVGIGLTLVKELVDLYKGKILTTLENSELSFIVNLPLAATNLNAFVIPAQIDTTIVDDPQIITTEIPILLIVDDNSEIRNILKDIFKNEYQIIEAQDGEQALKIAQKEIPDCIISDVMMPKIDGFEFTKQIKQNELTSFIPVILLTAKISENAHLEGLKANADAYLTKPFNNEIVKETVNQLISERKKLQKRYSQELILRPVDIVINSVDEKFLEKLQLVLDENLSNSDFSSEDFSNQIGMSRMQLHRKLKSILGVSTSEFLRNERLKVACELLKKGNGNISEIAYAVGFNDVSYFSKCFKEIYDCTPSDFIDKK